MTPTTPLPAERARALGLDLHRIETLLAPGEFVTGFDVVPIFDYRDGERWEAGVDWSSYPHTGSGNALGQGLTRDAAIEALYRLLALRMGQQP